MRISFAHGIPAFNFIRIGIHHNVARLDDFLAPSAVLYKHMTYSGLRNHFPITNVEKLPVDVDEITTTYGCDRTRKGIGSFGEGLVRAIRQDGANCTIVKATSRHVVVPIRPAASEWRYRTGLSVYL